jgi:sialic acid synthase SpsE
MLIDRFNTDDRVLVVAEIGNNHEGQFSLAEEMVCRAAEAGADAVKFQTFRTERFVAPSDAARFARLKQFELTQEEFGRLADRASSEGVLFISTPLDLESAVFLNDLVAAFKIASGDNTFMPLLGAVAGTGKPILLSCGIATIAELRDAWSAVARVWTASRIDQEMAVLHCVSSYPVPPDEANLAAIRALRDAFGGTVGYSDHTLGIQAAALSVAVGARIVEKHFTLDKQYSDFRDHQLSADPAELRQLVEQVRTIETLLGNGRKVPQPSEAAAKTAYRRSIAAVRDLAAGSTVTWDDIAWIRPGGGVAPGQEATVLGRTLARAVRQGEPLTLDVMEPVAVG